MFRPSVNLKSSGRVVRQSPRSKIASEIRLLEARQLLSGSVPIAEDASFTIPENLVSGSSVGTVVATDPDVGETLLYAITAGNTGNAFAINSSTGEITVSDASAVDFEVNPSFALTVQVSDSITPILTDTATISINLTNVNDPPKVALGSPVVTIDENTSTSIALIVTSVTVNDDSLGSETLSLSGPDAGVFQIVGSTLRVKAGTQLNYEAQSSYSVTVNVNDPTVGGNPDDSQVFTLNLNNLPEAPVIVANQRFQISPTSSNGTVVGTLNAFDPDGGPLQYAIINDPYGGLFQMNSTTGVITVANNTQLAVGTYTVTTRVRDTAGQAVNEPITIVSDTTTTLSGQMANQPVLDTDIIAPFASLSVNDPDNQTLTVRVEIPNVFRGDFTPASVAGWTRSTTSSGARYFRAFSAVNVGSVMTDALRSLVFQPMPDSLPDGQSETLGFILLLNTGFGTINDSSVSIRITNENTAAVISGAVSSQAMNDNATLAPFNTLSVIDPDRQAASAQVQISNGVFRGDFTAASTVGWTKLIVGNNIQYSRSFNQTDVGAAATAAIQALVFQPRTNAIKPNTTEATNFTVSFFDGGTPASDSSTSVIVTSVNDAPILGGLNSNIPVSDNSTVNPLTSVTVSDLDQQELLISVTILNGVVRGDFTNATVANGWAVRQVLGNNITYKRYFSPQANVGAAAQAAFRALVFQPRQNAINPGTTEATDFQVTVGDGVAPAVLGTGTRVTTTSVNNAPVISGAVAGQTLNDNQTKAVFSTLTVTDPDTQAMNVIITIPNGVNRGDFTAGSTTGWTRTVVGVDLRYNRFFSATANIGATVQTAIRGLVFQPRTNVSIGTTETTGFTVFLNDGLANTTNSTTTVITTGVAPRVASSPSEVAALFRDSDIKTVIVPTVTKPKSNPLARLFGKSR